MSTNLTSEQALRIEENKRRALEKLKAKNTPPQQAPPIVKTMQQKNRLFFNSFCNSADTTSPNSSAFLKSSNHSSTASTATGDVRNFPFSNRSSVSHSALANDNSNCLTVTTPQSPADGLQFDLSGFDDSFDEFPPVSNNNQTVGNRTRTLAPIFGMNGSSAKSNYSGSSKPNSELSSKSNRNCISPNSKNYFNQRTVVNGHCVMVSRTRFMVDAPYHQRLIDVCKSMQTRLYEPTEKRWTFELSEHEKIVHKLADLKPEVSIAPLPKFITKLFEFGSVAQRVIAEVDLSSIDETLQQSLMPFQREGVSFAISKHGKVLIADDMGLGKTIQAIAVCDYYRHEWPVLVVCPASVRYSWLESFNKWVSHLRVHQIKVLDGKKDVIDASDKVVICSYDLITKMGKHFQDRRFKVIIFDESHFLKNVKSARTQAATPIMKAARRVLLLTGTPALSRPMELYTQISALCSLDFPSYIEFGIRYCAGHKGLWGWDYSGASNMAELQILLEEKVMIRRLKSEVLDQLPPKQRQMVLLDPKSIDSENEMMAGYARKMSLDCSMKDKRSTLLTYFSESGFAKMKAIKEYVETLLEANRKFLLFAHHQIVLNGVQELLESKEVKFIRVDGSTTAEQRKVLVDRFQNNDRTRVAILSVTAANTGITLTAAHLVVFAELFWNPGVLTQAEDRAHRIGQKDCVIIQYLVAKGTADDYLWPLVQSKLEVLNQAGLSKDSFKEASFTRFKDQQKRIEDFWSEMEEIDFDADFDLGEPSVKKPKPSLEIGNYSSSTDDDVDITLTPLEELLKKKS